jgi:hypothetical protein
MYEAGSVIDATGETPWGTRFGFRARVLYWWEVQEIRTRSLVRDRMTQKNFLDRSKLQGQMVDLFLEGLTDDEGNVLMRSDLEPGEPWKNRLHPTIIRPLYEAYDRTCNPSTEELNAFRERVKAYFDPVLRGDGMYIVPPEIWEVTLLSRVGGMTLSEVRRLSYVEMKKFLIVVEFMDRPNVVVGPPTGPKDPFADLIPAAMLMGAEGGSPGGS